MPNNNTNDLALEVRKAYRFLFDYQSHILNLMQFIQGSYGLSYIGGYPIFSWPAPQRGRGSLDSWSWDWLNMYFYHFSFKKTEDQYCSVFLANDTGFYQKRDESIPEGKNDRLSLSNYEKIEDAQTKLIFVANYGKWNTVDDWQSKEFLLLNKPKGMKTFDNGTMIYMSFTLADFENQEQAIDSLRKFAAYCKEYQIPIQYIEKTI